MMAGAGGAMRATGWRATAIGFQQFGEGPILFVSPKILKSSHNRIRPIHRSNYRGRAYS